MSREKTFHRKRTNVEMEEEREEGGRRRKRRRTGLNKELEESLKKPLESSNKGFQLLVKMGYMPGRPLGKDLEKSIGRSGSTRMIRASKEEPRLEPIEIKVKNNRSGLGRDREKRKRKKGRKRGNSGDESGRGAGIQWLKAETLNPTASERKLVVDKKQITSNHGPSSSRNPFRSNCGALFGQRIERTHSNHEMNITTSLKNNERHKSTVSNLNSKNPFRSCTEIEDIKRIENKKSMDTNRRSKITIVDNRRLEKDKRRVDRCNESHASKIEEEKHHRTTESLIRRLREDWQTNNGCGNSLKKRRSHEGRSLLEFCDGKTRRENNSNVEKIEGERSRSNHDYTRTMEHAFEKNPFRSRENNSTTSKANPPLLSSTRISSNRNSHNQPQHSHRIHRIERSISSARSNGIITGRMELSKQTNRKKERYHPRSRSKRNSLETDDDGCLSAAYRPVQSKNVSQKDDFSQSSCSRFEIPFPINGKDDPSSSNSTTSLNQNPFRPVAEMDALQLNLSSDEEFEILGKNDENNHHRVPGSTHIHTVERYSRSQLRRIRRIRSKRKYNKELEQESNVTSTTGENDEMTRCVIANTRNEREPISRRERSPPFIATISRGGHNVRMNNSMLKYCKEHLMRAIADFGPAINCERCETRNGVIEVECTSQAVYDHLRVAVINIPAFDNSKFICNSSKHMTRVGFFCLGPSRRSRDVLDALQKQNPDLVTKQWRVLSSRSKKDSDRREGTSFVVAVDSNSLGILKRKYDMRPYFELGRIEFNVHR